GIGFFSVFMWGQHVRVTTRRPEEARKDTRVLEFSTGLSSRPILRPATEEELVREGGTRVRIWLKTPPEKHGGLLHICGGEPKTLERLCEWLCPALDVTLFVEEGTRKTRVIEASDWLTMDGVALLRRLSGEEKVDEAARLRPVLEPSGQVVGRAAI